MEGTIRYGTVRNGKVKIGRIGAVRCKIVRRFDRSGDVYCDSLRWYGAMLCCNLRCGDTVMCSKIRYRVVRMLQIRCDTVKCITIR